MFIRHTGEPVLAQVVGYSEHGDAYHRISDERRQDNPATVFFRCALQFLCLKICVYVVVRIPREGWGTVTWHPSPRGWRGTVFPGVGQDKGVGWV